MPRECPNCGSSQKTEGRFCAFCGTEFPPDAHPTLNQTININVNTSQPPASTDPDSTNVTTPEAPADSKPEASKPTNTSKKQGIDTPSLIVLVAFGVVTFLCMIWGFAAVQRMQAESQQLAEQQRKKANEFAAAAQTWNGWYRRDDLKKPFTATFVWDHSTNQLKGTINDATDGKDYQMTGNVTDGDQVMFVKKNVLSVIYNGTLSEDKRTIDGTWKMPESLVTVETSGEFHMTRSDESGN